MTTATAATVRLEENFADLTDPRSREGTYLLINVVDIRLHVLWQDVFN